MKLKDKILKLISYARYHKAIQEYINDGINSRGTIFSYNAFIKEIVDFDFSKSPNFNNMFQYCTGVERIVIDNHIATGYSAAFRNCSSLKSLKTIDMTTVSATSEWLKGCDNLEELFFVPNSIWNVLIIPCPKLNDESIQSIIDGLRHKVSAEPYNITLAAEVTSRITDDQWQQIWDKNWNVI